MENKAHFVPLIRPRKVQYKININHSIIFLEYNQAIKVNLCQSKILILVESGFTGLMTVTTYIPLVYI